MNNSIVTAQARAGVATASKGHTPSNPSRSGDPWWDDKRNVALVERSKPAVA